MLASYEKIDFRLDRGEIYSVHNIPFKPKIMDGRLSRRSEKPSARER